MKKHSSIGLLALIILAFSSCTEKAHLLLDAKSFDVEAKKLDTIRGENTGIVVSGSTNIYSGDGFLFVESNNPNEQLAVYDAKDYTHLQPLCLKGRARNEFTFPTNYCKQICNNEGELIIPVRDSGLEMKFVNITKSLEKKATVVDDVRECISQNKGCELYINNSTETFEYYRAWSSDARTGDYEIPRYFINSKSKKEISVFGSLITDEQIPIIPSFIYSGNMRLKPDESKVVFYCVSMHYLFVFDLNESTAFAIHKSDELSFNDALPKDLTTLRLGYGDVCVTDKYIIALSPNGTETDYDDRSVMPILLVFDWNGNYLFGKTLDRRIYNISIDEVSKKLFGFERLNETVYTYNFSEIF